MNTEPNKGKEESPTEGTATVPEPSKTTEASSGTPITHAEDAGENKNGDTPFPAGVHISDAKSENSQNIQNGEKRKKKEKKTAARLRHIKRYAVSFVLLPSLAGVVTGAFIFFFRLIAEKSMALSEKVYTLVRANPEFIPLLIGGTALFGIAASGLNKLAPISSGGGIPTATAILRGLMPFEWIRTLICVFFASICTFLVGIPLDNEGPSVQIGTSIGRGISDLAGSRHKGADRYIMTAGSCAGISVTTGAPLSGIFFALEDSHRRFTPTIISSAAAGVICGVFTSHILMAVTGVSFTLFDIPVQPIFEFRHIWIVFVVGIIAAIINFGVLFLFESMDKHQFILHRIPRTLRYVILFVIVALCGLILPDALGTGHTLTDEIILGKAIWYLLPILLIVRAGLTTSVCAADITGGLFIPLITFGALTGAMCADLFVALGIIPAEYYGSVVIIGIGAFLAASLKTPITAILFTVEIFGALDNVLYLILAVAISFALTEICGKESINDVVMEYKISELRSFGKREIIDTRLTVKPGAFVIGKETRDILWPTSCQILNIKSRHGAHAVKGINEGDVLHVQFTTHDFERTERELCALVGEQKVHRNYSDDMRRGF